MNPDELKKGFWGYTKDSVYRYIAQREEEFSAKLSQQEAEQQAAVARLAEENQRRIADLEEAYAGKLAEQDKLAEENQQRIEQLKEDYANKLAEQNKLVAESQQQLLELKNALSNLQQEKAALQEGQMAISTTLIEAQKHAERLKLENTRREQQVQDELKAALAQKSEELAVYSARIQQLRENFQLLLKEMDGKVGELAQEVIVLQAQAPAAKLSPVLDNYREI